VLYRQEFNPQPQLFLLNGTFKTAHVVTTQTVSCDVEAVNVECELNYEMAVK
jgi:hypothetical protein